MLRTARGLLWLLPALVLLAAVVAPSGAAAQEREIAVLRHGVTTPLTLPEYTSQGIGYASLADIARQLNGRSEVAGVQVTFELDGTAVKAGLNNTEASTPQAVFELTHPILGYEGDALIAMEDVVPFLRAGFGFGTPEAPPTGSALSVTEVPVPADAPVSDAIMESNDLEAVSADRPNPDEVTLEEAPLESVAPAAPSASADTPLGDGPLVLAIDPGHGGEDTGVVGPGGLVEKTLTLNVAQTLRRILKEEYGMATVITRDDDTYVSAPARLGAARSGNATLLLSLHGGASTAPGARGPHLFAHKPKRSLSIDPKPALGIARQLASTLYDAALGTAQPVREVPLRVVQNSSIPCVLVELGNLLHPDDESQLSSETYQFSLATALAQGVANAVGAQRASGSPS